MIKTRLKTLRATTNEDKIISINEISLATGLSRQFLTDMERGRLATMDIGRFQEVCRYLGCHMKDLVVYDALEDFSKDKELSRANQ